MTFDVRAGLAGRGDGSAAVDADLVGVGLNGYICRLARVRQPDLDPLAAYHDRPADGDPPDHCERFGPDGAGDSECRQVVWPH